MSLHLCSRAKPYVWGVNYDLHNLCIVSLLLKIDLCSQIKPVMWRFLHSSTPRRASPCTSVGYSTSVHGSTASCAVMQCDSWRLGTLPAGGKSNVCVQLLDMVAHISGWCCCIHEERKMDRHYLMLVTCLPTMVNGGNIDPSTARVCENSLLFPSGSLKMCLEHVACVVSLLPDSRVSHICPTNCILYRTFDTASRVKNESKATNQSNN